MSASRSRPGTRLLDRYGERALVEEVLGQARAGSSAVLVVRGGPGIGNTALLDYAAGRALGFRVIWARGVESEIELAFAGLHQLCRRCSGHSRGGLRTSLASIRGSDPVR